MKLRNKLAAITAAAMLAFAGVGFAAWTFNNNSAQKAKIPNYVTSAINAKDVVISGDTTVYLVLDQAKPYWSIDAAAAGVGHKPVELANGKLTVAPDYDLQNQTDGASWTYTLTSAIDVDADIATYVNVTGFDTVSKTGTVTAAGGANQIAAVDYDLPALAYTANEPANYADYQTMLSTVRGKVITFTFNCTFAEN